ncbi:hypothetical protein M431DRAFT_509966 [Trichoderma harzianum CBS 226.95]|uniref:Uncharacterized protein n=1 Tax=Trichoderma harzianum CBS 226.95 TaxID=983964 RepID=A0A2T4A6I6_TRIHA|nr:hypothetical protein M431DRAFT_509966 [Trichoderma harzianum CBS 226.95]PTB52694.1 hypothetical protein M431DRAFT_509966 [Trichoderma harzianum CBS 226.95]
MQGFPSRVYERRKKWMDEQNRLIDQTCGINEDLGRVLYRPNDTSWMALSLGHIEEMLASSRVGMS